ncbi:hypothetical protein KUCAC02_031310 [Chaenocephalus aceratus]|uniref:Uncharacterized protein n=1 Tax=Chaenocephalus aceratus TaxID=36190 RepID=A0ACB9XNN9_CHAAC|nr:hypothetical protein KUCAC02_031310 [Chaenocephalus aceratus]
MAANSAFKREREREIFVKDGKYWMRSLFVTPNCQSFPGFEQQTNISMDCGAGGRDSGDGALYIHAWQG